MILSGNLTLLAFLYFIQGLPYGFQAKFLPVLLRSEGVSLTSVGFFKFLLAPWLCKALWAPLIDKYKTKRLWLLYSIFGLFLTCVFGIFITSKQLILLSFMLFFLNFWAATQDIVVDSISVSLLSVDELGYGNTVQAVGYKVGCIFGGGILVWFLDVIGWSGLFFALALLYVEAWMFVYVSPTLQNICMAEDISGNTEGEAYGDDATRSGSDSEHLSNYPQVTGDDIDGPENGSVEGEEPTSETGTHQQDVTTYWAFFTSIWRTAGTKWILMFVFAYKLGEQGILNMLPLYLIDKSISASDVTFWAGMVGQGISILGSALGGYLLTVFPTHLLLSQTCLLRLMPMGIILWTLMLWNAQVADSVLLYYVAMASFLFLMLFSGIVTTATFTAMMQCSKLAPTGIQATHYTSLATIEVFGKLAFATVSGWLVDLCGYTPVFLIFVLLAVAVLPLFRFYPSELQDLVNCSQTSEDEEESESDAQFYDESTSKNAQNETENKENVDSDSGESDSQVLQSGFQKGNNLKRRVADLAVTRDGGEKQSNETESEKMKSKLE